jgi:hypothetical protein
MSQSDPVERLPKDITRQIDELCAEYRTVLIASGSVSLEPFLGRIPPAGRSLLLKELCGMAVDRLQRQGSTGVANALAAAHCSTCS